MTHLSPKSPLSGRHPNPDVQDWDVMFRAVQARLRTAIDSLMSTSPLSLPWTNAMKPSMHWNNCASPPCGTGELRASARKAIPRAY